MSPKPIRLFSRAAVMLLTVLMAFTPQTAWALNGLASGTWFTLDGQRLNGKPTAKGLYINNGRKVVIK